MQNILNNQFFSCIEKDRQYKAKKFHDRGKDQNTEFLGILLNISAI